MIGRNTGSKYPVMAFVTLLRQLIKNAANMTGFTIDYGVIAIERETR
jgi:hypothetical protein